MRMVLIISGSCETLVGFLIVVEAEVEGLTWKDYLYFNLIMPRVHSVCHLSRFR